MERSLTYTPLESHWPGERDPSYHDVREATELPEPAFLSDYRNSLLASSDALDNESIMHLDLEVNEDRKYTYPLALLSDFPDELLPHNELVHLREVFSTCCSKHPFLGRLPIPSTSRQPITSPLCFAIGCVASVHSGGDVATSRDLCLASQGLWGATMEVDNREARSIELLITAILCNMYAALSTDKFVRNKAGVVLCSAATIARRMRFNDQKQLEELLGAPASSSSGAFIWCIWLIDIVNALHFSPPVCTFSSRELWTTMPGSKAEFQDVYRALIDARSPTIGPLLDVASHEDALLLLMALVSDLIYLRTSLGQSVCLDALQDKCSFRVNPFVPFSSHTELERMENTLSLGLDRWYLHFHDCVPPEIMAFYYYCRLYLTCRQVLSLASLAGYLETGPFPVSSHEFSASDDTARLAWLILDSAAARSQALSGDCLCPTWLPVVVFHAGLVLWAKHTFGGVQVRAQKGVGKMLLPFKMELEGMPWPCCEEMAATLERLMAAGAPEIAAQQRK